MRALLLENIHPQAQAAFEQAHYEVASQTTALDQEQLIAALAGISVLGIRSTTPITKYVLDQAPELAAIGAFCIGTNHIALDCAAERGIAVFNAPFSNTRSVVELVVSEMIALSRHLTDKNRLLHEGVWDKSATGAHEIRGRVLGIIGYGNIGSQLSVLAEALGMRVIFYDRADRLRLGNAESCATLDELLNRADVVSIHVDGREANRQAFGIRELSLMRTGALLLNLSRGFVVDVAALQEHLNSGHIAGAAIDVFPTEPKGRGAAFTSPLQGLDNVILTPHIGGSTEEAQEHIGSFVAGKLISYLQDGDTALSVNFPQVSPSASLGSRLGWLHENSPGALAALNQLLADHNANIISQTLATRDQFGYVTTDIDHAYDTGLSQAIEALPVTIRLTLHRKE